MKQKFTIDIDKWICGWDGPNKMGRGVTEMLNCQGYMCCLGQISKQMGVEDKFLLGRCDPCDVSYVCKDESYLENNPLLLKNEGNSILSEEAMKINDNPDITTEKRIKELKELFAEYEIELEFTNEQV